MFTIDGKDLKSIRKKMGFKKKDIVRYVECSLTAYTNWESGLSTPVEMSKVNRVTHFIKANGYAGKCKVNLD
jgi:DNA-binding transcriptional regulator YiaG